jgi:hypothetical protein
MHRETFRTFCDVIETGSLSAEARANEDLSDGRWPLTLAA